MTLHEKLWIRASHFSLFFTRDCEFPAACSSIIFNIWLICLQGASLTDWQRFLTMLKKCFSTPLKGPRNGLDKFRRYIGCSYSKTFILQFKWSVSYSESYGQLKVTLLHSQALPPQLVQWAIGDKWCLHWLCIMRRHVIYFPCLGASTQNLSDISASHLVVVGLQQELSKQYALRALCHSARSVCMHDIVVRNVHREVTAANA